MGSIFLQLLPMILGSALVPIWIILLLLILQSRNGLVKGAAFVAGATVVRLLQGVAFGYLFGASAAVGEAGAGPSPVVSVLLLIIGILLLIAAVKTYRNEPDPDDPPPRWMSLIDGASVGKIFGLGVLLTSVAAKLWVFTLSAIGIIKDAALGNEKGIALYLLYVFAAESLLILPLVIYTVAPTQSEGILKAAIAWLEKYNRLITISVSLIFGTLFLWKGTTGLLSVTL